MAAQKLIVVVGATGMQGGSVVDTFVADAAWKVRGLTRDPSSAKALALKAKGVEVVAAELDDRQSLERAFAGASVIFSVTDFTSALMSPALGEKETPAGVSAYLWGYRHELQQGKNVMDAASKVPGLERLVFSYLASPEKMSKGKFKRVLHYESKAQAVDYARDTYPDLWSKTSLLQAGIYLSNLTTFPFMKPEKVSEGSYRFVSPLRGDVPLPWIAAEQDTGPLTMALVDTPAGQDVAGYRELITADDFLRTWERVLGVKAEWQVLAPDQPVPHAPDFMVDGFGEICQFINEFPYFLSDAVTHPSEILNGKTLPSVESWVRAHDWSSVL